VKIGAVIDVLDGAALVPGADEVPVIIRFWADAGADGDDIDPGCDDSFAPATKVLLASGAVIPISQLKPGEKVLATNVKTGKTQAETVKAVILEHDNDLYDLTVKVHGKTAVIQTTQHHRFWDQTTGRWTYADALPAGDLLRTPGHAQVSVISGQAPADTVGWMWDLTIAHDHDFYIDVATTAVLVHNCPIKGYTRHGLNQAISRDGVGVSPSAISDAVSNPANIVEQSGGRLMYIRCQFACGHCLPL
jgi:hypothetical protein